MPIHKTDGGWQWGQHGHVYPSREGAEKQAAAAHAHGYTGDEGMPAAAGVALRAPDGSLLFMHRRGGDASGTWAFPGGMAEPGEDDCESAIRELAEETGLRLERPLRVTLDRQFGDVDFTTFGHPVDEKFTPVMNHEHDGFLWAKPDEAPRPLHPGVKATLEKMAFDPVKSEAQRRAMWAAKEGRSKLGIPKSVGEKFVGAGHDEAPDAGKPITIPLLIRLMEYAREKAPDDLVLHKIAERVDAAGGTVGSGDYERLVPEDKEQATDASQAALSARIKREIDRGHAPEQAAAIAYSELGEDALPAFDLPENPTTAFDRALTFFRKLDMIAKPNERAAIAFDKSSVRAYDIDGRLRVEKVNISKAAVNPYVGREIPDYDKLGLDPDRIYKLYRDPDELAEAAPSFNNLPVLSEHVPVNAENHQPDLVVGATGSDAEFELPFLTNSLVIWAKEGIDGIESDEKKELSSAYRYRADMTPGEVNGERYDGVMREIVGNHVALVKEGRAGSDVVVGDTNEEIRMKTTLIGAMVLNAIAGCVAPKLAQDQKVELSAAPFQGITSKNFKERKPQILAELKKLTEGKLAADASIDDVTELLDKLEKVEGVDAEMPAGLEPNSAIISGPNEEKKDPEALDNAWARDWLKSKGVADADISECEKMMAEKKGAPKAADADPDPDKDKDKDMVDKKAMDEAIKLAVDTTTKNITERHKALRAAERDVAPYVGELKVAQDSAEGVYETALDLLGVKDIKAKKLPLPALQAILQAQPKPGEKKITTIAQDAGATPPSDFAERWPSTQRIEHV